MISRFKKCISGSLLAACSLALSLGAVSTVSAQTSYDNYFAGKTVSIVIRSTPGGGYDFHGRLLARHLGKYLPGNPDVIAINRPGAGGIVAANYMYRQAPKDGTEIVIAARELALAERLGQPGVTYKTLEMPAIGNSASEARVWVTTNNSPVSNLADLEIFHRDFLFAVSGIGAGSGQMVQLLEQAGYPVRIITGYEGTSDQVLAMLRGEVDGINSTYDGIAELIRDENLKIFAKMGSHPELTEYDDVRDVLSGDMQVLANVLGADLEAGRPFFTAPGTPPEVVELLREGFRLALQDPDLLREAATAGQEINYVSPADMVRGYEQTLSAPDHIIDLFRD